MEKISGKNCEIKSHLALKHISEMLLEENTDENIIMFQEEAALKAVEKTFYDIIEEKYPPFSDILQTYNPYCANQYLLTNQSLPMLEFKRGLEEGMKFLPSNNNNTSNLIPSKPTKDGDKNEELNLVRYSKGKRHANWEELSPFEGPKCKISVLYFKDPAIGEIYDKVLLLHGDSYASEVIRLRKIMERIQSKKIIESRRKFSINKENNKEPVDLKSLLIHCSQAIAINNYKMANQLIKKIKTHSSPDGNGVERMARIFAIGLEARLAGTDKFYNQILYTPVTAIDMLNVYHILRISSPFITATDDFSHFTILNALNEESKLHIIHLGIEFGYQYPRLMQALSERKGIGSPKLRITGIDFPGYFGFQHEIETEEVARRLKSYARSFNIPFEYRAIGTKFGDICIEDINIEKDELVIVICFYRLENLGEEMDEMNCEKNRVLDKIRRINPNVFIQAVMSTSYNSAFFAPRFKQMVHHFSALFDLMDTNAPGDNKGRNFIENRLWAREAINLIAFEGPKRIERPETHKQWHVRNLRAGFEQLPLDRTVINKIKEISHNKNFFLEDDNEWLLLGWKGRTILGVSTWRPKQI